MMDKQVKFNVKMKLTMGFLVFYIISGIVPGTVSFFISVFDLSRETTDFLIPLLSLSVSLIICVIVGLYLMKWIVKPIKKLVRVTEEMARGNLEVDTHVETGDEIESLANSLSRMRASLKIAFDMLGPPETEEYVDPREIKGLAIGEKIVFALLLFLILNPVVTAIPIIFLRESTVITLIGISIVPLMFSVMLLCIFILHLNESIMNPFIFLTNAADKISKGDFKTKIEVRSSGDVGKLELNFKVIYERVQRAMKEMEPDA